MQILTVFALKKFGNSKLRGCEGIFSLDSPCTGGFFEGSHSLHVLVLWSVFRNSLYLHSVSVTKGGITGAIAKI